MKHGVSMLCLVALIRTTKNFFARLFNLLGIIKPSKERNKLAKTGSKGNKGKGVNENEKSNLQKHTNIERCNRGKNWILQRSSLVER